MKKIIYGALLLSIVGIGVVACKKDSLMRNSKTNQNPSSGILRSSLYQTDNNLLILNSVDDFDAVITMSSDDFNQALKELDYVSYEESLEGANENLIKDAFLSVALNKDQAIQIGNYIYRINKENQKVFALHKDKIEHYNDLVSENTSNKYVLFFSTEDNVFELLGEVDVVDAEKKSKNCQDTKKEDNGGWEEYADFVDEDDIYGNGTDKRYKFERRLMVRYDNWGIFRKLFTEFKHNEKWFGIFDGTYVSIAYEVQYNVKNGGSGNVTQYPSFPFATSSNYVGTSGYEFFTDNKEIIHYKGTKCLKSYKLKSWCWMRNRETLKPNLYPNNATGLEIIGN